MFSSILRFFFGDPKANAHLQMIIRDTKNTILVDVRSKEEHQQGNPKHSINIDVRNMVSQKDFFLKNKDKNFVVFCQSGMRSLQAVNYLKKWGLTKVYNGKTAHRVKSMQ